MIIFLIWKPGLRKVGNQSGIISTFWSGTGWRSVGDHFSHMEPRLKVQFLSLLEVEDNAKFSTDFVLKLSVVFFSTGIYLYYLQQR